MIRQRVVIGRDPRCDLVLDDEYASPRHCEVFEDYSGQVWVRDLGATNPVSIVPAGTPVPADHMTALLRSTRVRTGNVARLNPGDTLIVGRTRIPWTGATR